MRKLILVSLLFLAACAKSSTEPQQTVATTSIFSNSNITFVDYTYGLAYAGSNASLFVDAQFSNVTGITKAELVQTANNISLYELAPSNGVNRFYHHGRSAIHTQVQYYLRFTKTDNTKFQTGNFNVIK